MENNDASAYKQYYSQTTNNNSKQFKRENREGFPPEGTTQFRSQLRAARDGVIQEKIKDQIKKQPGRQ